jgi:hypothetical protein
MEDTPTAGLSGGASRTKFWAVAVEASTRPTSKMPRTFRTANRRVTRPFIFGLDSCFDNVIYHLLFWFPQARSGIDVEDLLDIERKVRTEEDSVRVSE